MKSKHKLILLTIILVCCNLSQEQIPKKIWTFWNSKVIPDVIQRCIDTWRRFNPTWEITILNDENLPEYIGCYETKAMKNWKFNDSVQRYSDLIRLEVLELYGGIWMDASMIINQPLDWVNEQGNVVLYSIIERSTTKPMIESWFLAVSKGHPFIQYANRDFRSITRYPTLVDYLNSVSKDIKSVVAYPSYLTVYISLFKAYRKYKNEVVVLSASHGPQNYNTQGGLLSLCFSKPYIVKLRKQEREELMNSKHLQRCAFENV